jgi:hypothetical protein
MANNENLIPAQKGEVRNPNGRPKKVDTVLKELFLRSTMSSYRKAKPTTSFNPF